jgi:hypothetical protein
MTIPQCFSKEPKARSICLAMAIPLRPIKVPPSRSSKEGLEKAHTRNFIDAIVSGAPVNAPLQAGLDASLPVQMALRSYWSHQTIAQAQLV